jgi:hypothetical protein
LGRGRAASHQGLVSRQKVHEEQERGAWALYILCIPIQVLAQNMQHTAQNYQTKLRIPVPTFYILYEYK